MMFPKATMYTVLLCILLFLSGGQAQDILGFESAVLSYIGSLIQDATYVSEVEGLATADPDALASFDNLLTATNLHDLTAQLTVFATLPAPYNAEFSSIFASVFSVELSLASQYGVLTAGDPFTGAAPSASATFPSMTSSDDLGSGAAASTSTSQFSSNTPAISTSAQSSTSPGAAITESTPSSQTNTLLSITTPTGTPTTTAVSKAQAASTALPLVAGLVAFVAGGLAIGL